MRFHVGVIIVSLLIAGARPTAQEPVKAPIQGGPGGDYFEFSCGPGRVLVGLRGSAGVLIDSVQAICARVDAAGATVDPQPQGPVFGSRPIDQTVTCRNQLAVYAASVSLSEQQPLAGSIHLSCRQIANYGEGGSEMVRLKGSGRLRGYRSPTPTTGAVDMGEFHDSVCPAPTYAVGIRGRAGTYLDAFGLLCAPKPSAAPAAATANLVGSEVSFQASNYLDRYIRHRGFLAYTEPIAGDLGRRDATFRIVAGLNGRCVSLESQNHPGHFLRHERFRIKLARREDTPLFRDDATFCLVSGLASSTGVSLESATIRGHFIRHRNSELWLDRADGGDLFRKDATFNVTHPGGQMIVR
jgi:hypothetical protein